MAVLVIYTGGTIGSLHKDPKDPLTPLVPGTWEQLRENVSSIDQLKIEIDSYEFKPPLDSSNMMSEHWLKIARVIKDNYDKYEGFLILHGTDTMTYTATALSFILENLSKPVILTGSQLPIGEVRSDAVQNLVTALQIAAPESTSRPGREIPVVPEVCVFFQNSLLRGNRTRKYSASGYDAFRSPNYPPLGAAGEHIIIDESLIRKQSKGNFYINENLETNVMSIDIFPGINPKVLRKTFEAENLRGVVLKTYGTGNAPTTDMFLDVIEDFVRKEIVFLDVTQCFSGMVEIGLYETSAELLNRGVVSGLDMTPEAALCKLQYLLGLGYKYSDVCRYIQQDRRGEQSQNIYDITCEGGIADPIGRAGPQPIPGRLERDAITHAVIRIQGVKFDGTGKRFSVKTFVNLASADQSTSETDPHFVGKVERVWEEKPLNLFFDATQTTQTVLNPELPVLVNIVTDQERISWKRLILSVYSRA